MFVLDWDDIDEQGQVCSWQQEASEFPSLVELEKTSTCKFLQPVSAELSIRWIAQLLDVSGEVQSSVELSCSRCLKTIRQDLSGYFSLTYTREMLQIDSTDDDGDDEVELTPDDLGLIHSPDDEIDLHDQVAEQLIMALPVRPLCDASCPGLCSVCGQDLNQGPCGCDKPVFNSKFAALKDLKIDE